MSIEDEINYLRMRLEEIEALANDGLDLAIGAPLPRVRLTPPPTPQQEVFGGSGGGGIFPGPLQIESSEDGIYLVQKWCKPKGKMYEVVERLSSSDYAGLDHDAIIGVGGDHRYAARIRLFTHAQDHAEGVIPNTES